MTLSEFKTALSGNSSLDFIQTDGNPVPPHFHLTEIGIVNKKFIDCGGTFRSEEKVSLQLWYSVDTEHRLTTEKLEQIVNMGQDKLGLNDQEVIVEYQGETLSIYGLEYKDGAFHLQQTKTDCLAADACGVSDTMIEVGASEASCEPGGGCC